MTKQRKITVWLLVLAFILIAADQLTKLAVAGVFGDSFKLTSGEIVEFIGSFVQFTYVENAGMAFGITFGIWKILLSLFSIAASAGLVWLLYKIEKLGFWLKLGFAVILAGAAGNLIDRVFYGIIFEHGSLFYGNVIDFILVDIPDIDFAGFHYTHWPVFNIADACVTIGVAILIFN